MYEFTKKEIKEKFKKTKYGKKTNKWLKISLIIAIICILSPFVLGFLEGAEIINLESETSALILDILSPIIFIASCTACYFDGKRDGAIEQFKKDLK